MVMARRRRWILFAADNGVSLVMYRPVARLLAGDPRVGQLHSVAWKHTRRSVEDVPDRRTYLERHGLTGRVVHYRIGRHLPVDVFLTPSFNDRIQARNARLSIQMFHGVSFKNYCVKEKALRYDRLFLPGPYHRRRYVESGLFTADDPRLRVVGMPKLDRLVDGSLERAAILTALRLDPALPTVLYAPTGDAGNSLHRRGQEIIDTLLALPINLIVKPHDHAHRDPGCSIDWPGRLRALRAPRLVAALHSDVVPLMAAADLLVTDASSVAMEYTILDRPIVFMDVPEILGGHRAHRFDLQTWGRKGGDVVVETRELLELVPSLLENPTEKGAIRRAIAADLFHRPGTAAERTAAALYEEMGLEPPAATEDSGPPAGNDRSFVRERPRSRWGRRRRIAAFLVAAVGIGILCNLPEAQTASLPVSAAAETAAAVPDAPHVEDPAIWIDPGDPARSLIIGTDSRAGLRVYDLRGNQLQRLGKGKRNAVDLRQDVPLAAGRGTVVASSDPEMDTVILYVLDEAARRLHESPAARFVTGVEPHGLCLYRAPGRAPLYVFVVGDRAGDPGWVEQWEVTLAAQDASPPRLVRSFDVGSEAEGCVADDESGQLYIAEEDVGLWRYAAAPDGGEARVRVDATAPAGNLVNDVEGLALYRGPGGTGWLVASCQGADDFAVYRRGNPNAYVGRFHVVGKGGIDGVSGSDGIEAASVSLGVGFDTGVFVAQDSDNGGSRNFKLVAWSDIASTLALR